MITGTALWYASRATGVVSLVLFSVVAILGIMVNRQGRLPGLPRFAVTASTRHPDAWVTASKLCARKRPELFPVRDRKVFAYLGLTRNNSYRIAWQVFRHLIGDRDVIAAIDALSDATLADGQGTRLRLDDSRLRLLDAAIWTDTLRSV
jgi:hypothetical protein